MSAFLIHHIYNSEGRQLKIEELLESDPSTWDRSLSMEFGRLLKGNKYGVEWTDTMEFIPHTSLPKGKKVTYAQYVCDHRPLKPEKYWVQVVVGGDCLDCTIDSGSPTTSVLEFKLLINSIISDADFGVKNFTMDLKDFFLCNANVLPQIYEN